ncbi:hypothetical protein [Burkholderia mallei]|nr:hypothetical protein [Burkholderia mallei]
MKKRFTEQQIIGFLKEAYFRESNLPRVMPQSSPFSLLEQRKR